jgi:uncharacterized protein (DUF1330 family)
MTDAVASAVAHAASPAWVIGRIRVRDAEAWQRYRTQVPASIEPFGGQVLLRGAGGALLEERGEAPLPSAPHPDVVVLRFPSEASALAWFRSPTYQALIPLREAGADVVLTIYPG